MWQQVCAVILMIAAFFLLVIIIDGNRFVIRNYKITLPRLKKDTTFILLSDLHNKDYGKNNQKLLRAIRNIRPDGIIVAGDMVSASKGESMAPSLSLLLKLSEHYPIYYGNGNHESKVERSPEVFGTEYASYRRSLENAGIKFLINESIFLRENNISIYGLETRGEYYRRFFSCPMPEEYLSKQVGKSDPHRINILIAHNPEYFDNYVRWGADIVASGHIHGGMMRLPVLGGVVSPKLRLFPKYDGGLFHKDGTTMIVSRGIGDHWPNIRIFNPAELVVIRMKAK